MTANKQQARTHMRSLQSVCRSADVVIVITAAAAVVVGVVFLRSQQIRRAVCTAPAPVVVR